MLSLSVSNKPCLPGQKVDDAGPRPTSCRGCDGPGGKDGRLLEKHYTSGSKFTYVCPFCHHCLHLDHAGMVKSGKIIWLPEVSQENLNHLCLAMFLVLHKSGVNRDHDDSKVLLGHVKLMYGAFRKRAEHVEHAFGSGAMDKLGPKDYLSEPQHLASLMHYAAFKTGMNEKEMADKVQGMRFLPSPIYFDSYTRAVSKDVNSNYPVNTWVQLVREFASASEHADASVPAESFDVEDMDGFAVRTQPAVTSVTES